MKKLLPSAGSFLVKNVKSATAFLSLLILLCLSGSSQAQTMYYLGSDGSLTNNAGDGIYKVNQDGTGLARVCNGVSAPQDMALDLPNNRAFVTSFTPSGNTTATANGLYRIDLGTGTATKILATNDGFRVANLTYDPVNDWIYYTSNDGNGATTVAADGLYRIKTDGTSNTALATGISPSPTFLGIDIPHNKIYIFESVVTAPKLMTYNLSGNSATLGGSVVMPRINGMDYDPVNNWIYYTRDDGSTALTTDDALWKMHPDGTSQTKIISSLTANPNIVTVERTRNIAFVWNSTAGDRRIVKVDIAAGTQSAFPISPAFSISNQVAAIVIPAASKVATLSGFTVSSGTLSPAFATGTTTYTASVANSVSSITVTPTKTDAFASIKVNGTTVASASASGVLTLNIGDNVISTVVTAEDGLTTKTYTLTVTRPKAAQTITFGTIAAKTYGDVDFAAGASASSGLAVSLSSGNTAVATISGTNIHIVGAGTAIITAAQSGDASYLAATSVAQTLTVNQASQTITFGPIAAKTYGNADFATGGSVNSNLTVSYTSSNTNVATILGSTIHIVGAGTANITAAQAGDANRSAATSVVQALTVNKNAITVTATANQTKVYGNADPASYTYAITTGTLKSGDAFTGALSRAAGSDVGTYGITVGTLSLSNNYTLTYTGANFTITKRPLEITPTVQTKAYGDSDPASYTYSFTSGTSLASGDGMTGVFTRPTGEIPGVYAFSLGTKHPVNTSTSVDATSNYTLSFVSTNLTITKRAITLQPAPATKTYGSADPGFPYYFRVGSVAPGEGMTGVFGRAAGEDVGTYALTLGSKKPVNPSTGVFTDQYYDISFLSENLTITKKTVNVSANAKVKSYGDTDPALTYNADALVNSDTFSGALTRATGEVPGVYAITQGTLALSTNYTINFTGANLTIGKKTINVTANAQSKTYGVADPTLTYIADALKSGDSFTGSLTRAAGEGVGTYAINQGSLALNTTNYTINYTGNNLAIGKATLSYVATPVTRTYQTPNPAFTGTVTGFVSGDTQANSTTGTLSFATTATQSSAPGSYAITGSGLSAANYNFVQAAGNNTAFTITASADATLAGLSVTPGTLGTFNPNTTGYGASVANNVTSFQLTATVNQTNATIAINGSPLTSGNAQTIALSAGGNYFNVTVTAQNGDTKIYTVNIFRAYATNNLLSSLNLSGITFTPVFDPNTTNYTASVSNAVASTDVYGVPQDATATVSVAGTPVSAASPYSHALSVGENTVSILSKAQDGTDKYYTVTVTRAPSSDATLSAISLSDGVTLNTAFTPGLHSYYARSLTYATGIYISSAVATPGAVITVNGNAHNPYSGNFVSLNYGNNNITLEVTAQDGITTGIYTVNVIRPRSSDATLAGLNIPNGNGTINESFDPAQFNYTGTVPDSTFTGLPLTIYLGSITASVKVNDIAVADPQHYFMALHGGENKFKIDVTAQDTSATKTYNLVVTRAGQAPPVFSPNADLLSLGVSAPATSFSNNFNFAYQTLTPMTAPYSISAINLFLYTANAHATATVNGVPVPGANQELNLYPITLEVGENILNVLITAEDGIHTKPYEIHITRLPYVNVDLASLAISKGTLAPVFSAATTTYNTTVKNSVSSITVTPVSASTTVTMTVNNVAVSAANPSVTVNLIPGINRIRTIITGADGSTRKTYTVNVTRQAPQPTLANLILSAGTPSPVFDEDVFDYTASVANSVNNITVTPTLTDPTATITVNDVAATSGAASAGIPLVIGDNTIAVKVSSQDGATVNTYTLTITRSKAAQVITFNPIAAKISNDAPFTLSATGGASGNPVTYSSSNTTVATIAGNIVTIKGAGTTAITANQAGDANYQAATGVTQQLTVNAVILSANAGISSIAVTPSGPLTLTTGTGDYNYATTVGNTQNTIRVTTVTSEANATIKVNDSAVSSGAASQAITLSGASTTISIVVTAQDGHTIQTYTLTVNKAISNNAGITSIATTPVGPLTLTTGTGDYNYATTVGNTQNTIRITTVTADAGATIKVNDVAVNSGSASQAITLGGASTAIRIVVTAQDGSTTKTYTLAVNKTISNNAGITSIVTTPSGPLTLTTGTGDYNYATTVGNTQNTIQLTTVTADAGATIKVNDVPVNSGAASQAITLSGASTIIRIVVTAQDGLTTKTNTVTVNKIISHNAGISSIGTTPGSQLTVTTGTGDYNYAASVSPTLNTIRVTTVTTDAGATITVNNVAVNSGSASQAITLSGASTLITIVVTAQDGQTIKTYTLTVNKSTNNIGVNPIANALNSPLVEKSQPDALGAGNGIIVHQAVSPNGDGQNDVLQIEGLSAYSKNQLTIMNAAGAAIYETSDYSVTGGIFDGHSNKTGVLQKPGTYYYILNYSDAKGSYKKTGYIILKY